MDGVWSGSIRISECSIFVSVMPQNRDAAQSLKIDFVITSMGPVYEDPDAFKVDPHTQDNLTYGHCGNLRCYVTTIYIWTKNYLIELDSL